MGRKFTLSEYIKQLKTKGELVEINVEVSSDLEMTEIVDRISKDPSGGKAILFRNSGTDFPVLMNALGSEERIRLAFRGRSPIEVGNEVQNLLKKLAGPGDGFLKQLSKLPHIAKARRWMPRKKKRKGICQEIVQSSPNLNSIPILNCWPADGGSFVTLPLVHTMDPITGLRNLGMYRMQVFDEQMTGMHWHIHKTGARHYREYKKLNRKMPVAVALGGDPVYTYAATAPLPDGIDEYLLAGFIRNKPVNLVKCLTQDLWVPEDADFILEGYVDPNEDLILEGPFGDHTGFYSLADYYPKFHITAITHRKEAIYPATIVGIPPMEDAAIQMATEQLFIEPLKLSMIPELVDFHLPVAGVAHNIGLFSVKIDYPGIGRKILNAVWGAGQMMFTKFVLVFDEEVNLKDYSEIMRQMSKRVRPNQDVFFSNGPLDVLDHASDQLGVGGKMGIDVTGEYQNWSVHEKHAEEEVSILRSQNPDIRRIDISLTSRDISVGLILFNKVQATTAKQISQEVLLCKELSKIRFWMLSDIDLTDLSWFEAAWILGSHTDPGRDAWILTPDVDYVHPGALFLDATIKTKQADNFQREWPNPVVMNKETISLVNKKWPQYKLGPLIESPSLRYSKIARGDQAVAD